MLYSWTSPDEQTDRIYLFPDPRAARSAAVSPDRTLYGLAVRYEEQGRCLAPTRHDLGALHPRWTAPARADAHGTVIARGPLPSELYVQVVHTPRPGRRADREDRIPLRPPMAVKS